MVSDYAAWFLKSMVSLYRPQRHSLVMSGAWNLGSNRWFSVLLFCLWHGQDIQPPWHSISSSKNGLIIPIPYDYCKEYLSCLNLLAYCSFSVNVNCVLLSLFLDKIAAAPIRLWQVKNEWRITALTTLVYSYNIHIHILKHVGVYTCLVLTACYTDFT